MRDLTELDAFRRRDVETRLYGLIGDGTCGVFDISGSASTLRVIASSDGAWDHVSVSLPNRCPNWGEMELVKRKFFKDEETAMQLHVPVADHISLHPNCLHLWRPQRVEIPLPPKEFVA
jgi:hypothetical protein